MGTRFLLTRESPAPDAVKARYLEASPEQIQVSAKVDGIPQRMIRNRLLDRIERAGALGRWLRALSAGRAMQQATGASLGELWRTARAMSREGAMSLPQALMAASAPTLIQKAVVGGDPDEGLMASGQVAGRIADLPTCRELVERIATDARERLAALSAGRAAAA
jgi:NAD(P)H-dependent flavin oxidoreductase YrpB (nitropropane dioxygenase family)